MLVYCNNIGDLIAAMGFAYDPTKFQLFIDSSSRSLKAVLLFNGNKISSVPVVYSVHMTENYRNMELLLTALQYKDHNWLICGDLKVSFENTGIIFYYEFNIRNFYHDLSLI